MNFFPIFFIIFKIAVIGTGMFFAVKWHYDQDKKSQRKDVLSVVGKISAILTVSLLGLLFITFKLASIIGLDTSLTR